MKMKSIQEERFSWIVYVDTFSFVEEAKRATFLLDSAKRVGFSSCDVADGGLGDVENDDIVAVGNIDVKIGVMLVDEPFKVCTPSSF